MYLRYNVVAISIKAEDTASNATLKGQVAIPDSVVGVTTAPSSVPMMTKQTRANNSGIFIGRPISAAATKMVMKPG